MRPFESKARIGNFARLCLACAVAIGASKLAWVSDEELEKQSQSANPMAHLAQGGAQLYALDIGAGKRATEDRIKRMYLRAQPAESGRLGQALEVPLGVYQSWSLEIKPGEDFRLGLDYAVSGGVENKHAPGSRVPAHLAINLPAERFEYDGKQLRVPSIAPGKYKLYVYSAALGEGGKFYGAVAGKEPQCSEAKDGCAVGVVLAKDVPFEKPSGLLRKVAGALAGVPLSLPLLAPFGFVLWRRKLYPAACAAVCAANPEWGMKMPLPDAGRKPFSNV